MLNIVCVNAGNYLGRGQWYVDQLHMGIQKNVTIPHKFVVFNDANLPPETLRRGWYNKLYLFKRGVLNGRVLFFDLDTIILQNIDDIAQCQSPFAMLSDFMRHGIYGSGIMAWDADTMPDIYQMWLDDGAPNHWDGDQGIIKALAPKPDLLQNAYGGIHSYKVHGVRKDTRVLCFHGKPKPHETDLWQDNHTDISRKK